MFKNRFSDKPLLQNGLISPQNHAAGVVLFYYTMSYKVANTF